MFTSVSFHLVLVSKWTLLIFNAKYDIKSILISRFMLLSILI
jgi:hypothetical protein